MAFTGFYRKNWKLLFDRGGSPIQNASIEADDNIDVLKVPVQQSIIGWAKQISDIIEEGMAQGEFQGYFPPHRQDFHFESWRSSQQLCRLGRW